MKNQTSGTLQVPAGNAQAAGKMQSRLSAWLERENQFISSLMEESVQNKRALWIAGAAISFSATLLFCMAGEGKNERNTQKMPKRLARYAKITHLCSALHLIRARWLAKFAAGIFYAHRRRILYSSVPCEVLMDSLPLSGVTQRGAELFLSPSRNFIVSF